MRITGRRFDTYLEKKSSADKVGSTRSSFSFFTILRLFPDLPTLTTVMSRFK